MGVYKLVLPLRDITRGIVQRVRNPLNALQLNVDNLEDEIAALKIKEKRDIPERLRRIRNAIGELDSLLCEVLRLTDLPAPQITAVNVNALVREVEIFVKPESSKKEVTVKIELRDNLPQIYADPVQIKQAILNVLLNAIQASPVKGSVTLATERDTNHIAIRVSDNGDGIPLTCRDRVFEPFFSTKEGAVGLGLPLASEIVKMHQGAISFESGVGGGSVFVISLPVRADVSKE
jgi:signal transduction histidine kinase